MFSFDHLSRVATAAVAAFVLSTLSVVAAVGPAAQSGGTERAVYAQAVKAVAHG